MKEFTITVTNHWPYDYEMVDLVHWLKYQDRNRRKRAKYFYRKFPLFAVDLMREKYPDYTYEELIADITRPVKRSKRFRKSKTPLSRCGRYQEMVRCIYRYQDYKQVEDLQMAQKLRNRMWLPWIVQKAWGKKEATYQFPYTVGINIIKGFSQLLDKCSSIEEANKLYEDYWANNMHISSINDSK